MAEEPRPISVLFVCLGNICRSPMAEAVFRLVFASLDPVHISQTQCDKTWLAASIQDH